MIISHRHRFIFLHCRKVAGSSIAAALAPHLGPDDLHLGTWPEAWRAGVAPNRRAWRDLRHPAAAASFVGRLLRAPARLGDPAHRIMAFNGAQRLAYRARLGRSPEHAHAERVRAFDPSAWRDYFKFAFVRNPYERAVSDYCWRTSKTGRRDLGFGAFLRGLAEGDVRDRVLPRHFDNWPIYTIDDRIAVDFVGRFEHLHRDLARVFERLGLPGPDLPHAKASSERQPTAGWYGDEERQWVETLFARELAAFGYRFPERSTTESEALRSVG
ncbi:sulfotransferase family protein [Wenzhouxiangella sp. XN79A]|uniref:sulfotransferase family 2 domain-containing protein n=1 Tax=Wenzhouxiangella sp. XN79A TaxID=2724193 RepID=UPI00144A6D2C|nr:sulfotransferase family 2 domain-containing protein [Wenzhouxiangella sp. XN79A]NKI36607.1 sulfotransferase family protein [Wenzhouxiangella sp. XN79A]